MRKILQIIDAIVILHNVLIEFGEEKMDNWIDFDNFSDSNNMRAPYKDPDGLNLGMPTWMPKDKQRYHLLQYFKESMFLNI